MKKKLEKYKLVIKVICTLMFVCFILTNLSIHAAESKASIDLNSYSIGTEIVIENQTAEYLITGGNGNPYSIQIKHDNNQASTYHITLRDVSINNSGNWRSALSILATSENPLNIYFYLEGNNTFKGDNHGGITGLKNSNIAEANINVFFKASNQNGGSITIGSNYNNTPAITDNTDMNISIVPGEKISNIRVNNIEYSDIIKAFMDARLSNNKILSFSIDSSNAPTYIVSFDLMGIGEYIAPLEGIQDGATVNPPLEPLAKHYVFSGWYREKTFENLWNFSEDKVYEHTTLYAKWLKIELDPAIEIDFQTETLKGFIVGKTYLIEQEIFEILSDTGISIKAEWLGKKLSIQCLGIPNSSVSSETIELFIPNRPKYNALIYWEDIISTGILFTANESVNYSKDHGLTWQSSSLFSDLEIGKKYEFIFRICATDSSFCSESSEIMVISLISKESSMEQSRSEYKEQIQNIFSSLLRPSASILNLYNQILNQIDQIDSQQTIREIHQLLEEILKNARLQLTFENQREEYMEDCKELIHDCDGETSKVILEKILEEYCSLDYLMHSLDDLEKIYEEAKSSISLQLQKESYIRELQLLKEQMIQSENYSEENSFQIEEKMKAGAELIKKASSLENAKQNYEFILASLKNIPINKISIPLDKTGITFTLKSKKSFNSELILSIEKNELTEDKKQLFCENLLKKRVTLHLLATLSLKKELANLSHSEIKASFTIRTILQGSEIKLSEGEYWMEFKLTDSSMKMKNVRMIRFNLNQETEIMNSSFESSQLSFFASELGEFYLVGEMREETLQKVHQILISMILIEALFLLSILYFKKNKINRLHCSIAGLFPLLMTQYYIANSTIVLIFLESFLALILFIGILYLLFGFNKEEKNGRK